MAAMLRITDGRSLGRRFGTSHMLRLILLWGFRDGAKIVQMGRDEQQSCLRFRFGDQRAIDLIPPPWHLVDELASEVLRLESLPRRLAIWWDSWRGGIVPAGQEGSISANIGEMRTLIEYEILHHPTGTWIGLEFRPHPDLAVQAESILRAHAECREQD
jgi:hypothetical protein